MKTKDTLGQSSIFGSEINFQAKCKQTADLPQEGKQAAELLHKNGTLPQYKNTNLK